MMNKAAANNASAVPATSRMNAIDLSCRGTPQPGWPQIFWVPHMSGGTHKRVPNCSDVRKVRTPAPSLKKEYGEPVMDTVLFTDHGIVVFAITTSAIALMLSVLGLATTHQTRSDVEHQIRGLP